MILRSNLAPCGQYQRTKQQHIR